MERLKELVDLCKERKNLMYTNLFSTFYLDEQFNELSQKINRLAKQYGIYEINDFRSAIDIAFYSVEDLMTFTKDEKLSVKHQDFDDGTSKLVYSATFFDGDLFLYAYEKLDKEDEEHKNAQAM